LDASVTAFVVAIGRSGTIIIPQELRERHDLTDGSVVSVEATAEGILLRPVDQPPVEIYTPERIAQFLLTNAVDEQDYERAREDVRDLGLSPDDIHH